METPLLRSARCGWAAGTMLGACAPRSKRGHGASAGSTACVLDARGPNGCGLVYGVGKNLDPVAPLAMRALGGGFGQHQRELLAPGAAGDVAAADMALQQRGDLHEDQVAGGVPGGVVDLLEAVEVDHDQRDPAPFAPGADQLAWQIISQEAPVIQARQGIPDRFLLQVLQRPLEPLDGAGALPDHGA